MILEVTRGSIRVALADKTITVPGEMFFPESGRIGFVIFRDQIRNWDYPNHEIELTQCDVDDVINDIRVDFEKGGHSMEIE